MRCKQQSITHSTCLYMLKKIVVSKYFFAFPLFITTLKSMPHTDTHIIFFDGVCNLCNGSVQFIIRHDKKGIFKFASLQSDYAASLPELKGYTSDSLSTLIFQQGDTLFIKSAAALRIARLLRFPISFAYMFIIVPRPLRDFIYDWVSRNRYAWFGRRDACWLPTPELKGRFLE